MVDVLDTVRLYIKEMVHLAGPQMKIMLMDKETTSIVSCAYGQNEMMQKEVYIFERIDNGIQREPIKYLKCIVYIRPTPDNLHLLQEELRNPRYAQYYIYFSNIVSKADLKMLAEADEQETVRDVQEFFIDSIALSANLCSLSIARPYEHQFGAMSVQAHRRCAEALISLLLSLKKRPLIRFQRSSEDATKLAQKVGEVIRREAQLFEETTADTMLLVIDRFEDPVTPLLNQWTYEAMVHELLTFKQNCVTVEGNKYVLNERDDDFYARNICSNFGEIGANCKELITEYQQKANTHKNVESIADMKQFVEEYPQFKKMSGSVSKHVAIIGELSRLVAAHNLLEVSETEQSMVVDGDQARALERLKQLLAHPKTTQLDATRLIMLYALRFEGANAADLRALVQKLRNSEATEQLMTLLKYAGASRRRGDLFGSANPMEITKRFIKGLKGVENIYTQHVPLLQQQLDAAARGRLVDAAYGMLNQDGIPNTRIDHIIVFIVGGATFAESALVRQWNERRRAQPGLPSVTLQATHVHNTTSFIEQVSAMRQ
ncbi:hypothetical protein PFISCL1PPCAC_22806 [Pristionchus fissidentatus]|uniref:Vps-45 n=1 Tax=Pristionchus fissidentatus TaxID=1538716 RepID=A0AAV5WP21_9BILA|nr:hypothetical protein PFISCL1PPCAC_22806 [Pristionchus fissidentatus]